MLHEPGEESQGVFVLDVRIDPVDHWTLGHDLFVVSIADWADASTSIARH